MVKDSLEERPFYCMKSDFAFKKIYGEEENEHLLQDLIEKVINRKILKIERINVEIKGETILDKTRVLDLYVKVGKNEFVNIEINAKYGSWLRKRNFSYVSYEFSRKYRRGEKVYDEDLELIQINLSWNIPQKFELSRHSKNLYMVQGIYFDEPYIENFKIYEVNMDYYNKLLYNGSEKEVRDNYQLVMMTIENRKDLLKFKEDYPMAKEYVDKVIELNDNDDYVDWLPYEKNLEMSYNSALKEESEDLAKELAPKYAAEMAKDMAQDMAQDMAKDMAQDIAKDMAQKLANENMKTIIQKMLSKKLDVQLISELTGVSISQIQMI